MSKRKQRSIGPPVAQCPGQRHERTNLGERHPRPHVLRYEDPRALQARSAATLPTIRQMTLPCSRAFNPFPNGRTNHFRDEASSPSRDRRVCICHTIFHQTKMRTYIKNLGLGSLHLNVIYKYLKALNILSSEIILVKKVHLEKYFFIFLTLKLWLFNDT